MDPIRFPTAQELEQGVAAYEAEMQARHANPVPYAPRDCDYRDPPDPPERIYCDATGCGKVFTHEHRQVALMMLGKHRKAEHPETVEAG